MAAAPDNDSKKDRKAAAPLWLGSAARRGDAQARGAGWADPEAEDAQQPRWLGSVKRREGSRSGGAGWSEPEQEEGPRWLGSVARRGGQWPATETAEPSGGTGKSLYLVDLESKGEAAGEQTPKEPAQWQGSADRVRLGEVRLAEPLESPPPAQPGDELDERRQTRYVVGELGMTLRVVA